MRGNLTSLERLEAQIRALPDGTPQGAAWEEALVRWVNAGGHPDLVKGWGWKQWPGRTKAGLPRIERGVDLIAVDRAGRLVAIQAKFRNDPDSPVRTGEVQKFVGSYRKHFPRRMLISNASSRARGIREAVGDTEAELVLRTDLIESLFDWVTAKALPKPKVTPLPFQVEAATAVKKHLKDGGRAQIVMACGSGKTYTTLLAMEALGSKRVLVLAPTLLLVKQLRDEWMRERAKPWATLAVCSDIGTDEGSDSTQLSPGEIGAKPTTDPVEIAQFLKQKGAYVVFGTYASSARIATAQKKVGVPAFDLVVADEAHRIAGAIGKRDASERSQRVVLDEQGIRADRRLFATATPRVYGGDKKRDGEEILLESMDDPARFGEEVYKLTFQQAVGLKRLVPYKLLVTIVTDGEAATAIRERRYLDIKGKPIPADDIATAIAVRRAYKELGISRIISYHSSIARARAFAQLVQEIKAPGKAPEAECVTGAMPVEDRKDALTRLAAAEVPYLITNARCLTEGIDVPALDAIAFADPRRSQVDIVQAVGRAMRMPRGKTTKTTGYIILPVFLTKKELKDPESAVEGTAFAPVLQVLRALKAHDPFRAAFFAKILVEQGRRPHKKGEGIDEILEVSIGKELDRVLAKQLIAAVQLRAVEVSAGAFEFGLLHLIQYKMREGDCLVPNKHKESHYPLGTWVTARRSEFHGARSGLKNERIKRLDELGFVWDVDGLNWKRGIELLKEYRKSDSTRRVPRKTRWQDFPLWQFEQEARRKHKLGSLTNEQYADLESANILLDPFSLQWMKAYGLLKQYVQVHANADVPQGYRINTFSLGAWLSNQRNRIRNDKLPVRYRQLLEAIGVDWQTKDDKWDLYIGALERYIRTHGSTLVPENFVSDGLDLGHWIYQLRQQRYQERQPKERIAQLSQLGFIWDPRENNWQIALSELRKFQITNGHTLVPRDFIQEEFRLGAWTSKQRDAYLKGKLPKERVQVLEALGFAWNALDVRWQKGLLAFQTYRHQHPLDVNPTTTHIQDGYRLGQWLGVCRLRRRQGRLTKKKIAQLDQLGMVWNPPLRIATRSTR